MADRGAASVTAPEQPAEQTGHGRRGGTRSSHRRDDAVQQAGDGCQGIAGSPLPCPQQAVDHAGHGSERGSASCSGQRGSQVVDSVEQRRGNAIDRAGDGRDHWGNAADNLIDRTLRLRPQKAPRQIADRLQSSLDPLCSGWDSDVDEIALGEDIDRCQLPDNCAAIRRQEIDTNQRACSGRTRQHIATDIRADQRCVQSSRRIAADAAQSAGQAAHRGFHQPRHRGEDAIAAHQRAGNGRERPVDRVQHGRRELADGRGDSRDRGGKTIGELSHGLPGWRAKQASGKSAHRREPLLNALGRGRQGDLRNGAIARQ